MNDQETTKDNEWIRTKLNALIEKYSFQDVQYSFSIIATPELKEMLSGGCASSCKGIEHFEVNSPDLEGLKEIVKLCDEKNLIVRLPADTFPDLSETLLLLDSQVNMSDEQITNTDSAEGEFEFDSQECAAVAHDLAIIQHAEADRSELNFSVADLELLIQIAKGDFELKI